jgi:CubicO group peptidase (beta-lactamase class C family)
MMHTRVGYDEALARRVAPGHDADGTPVPVWHDDALAGAGAIVSTAADMLRYAQANLSSGGGEVETALRDARRPLRSFGHERRIGLAWIHDADGITWHNGGTGGYRSFLGLDETHHRAIVVLANAVLNGVDALGLHALDAKDPLPPPVAQDVVVDDKVLDGYVGWYRFSDNSTCHVTRDSGGLIAYFQPPGLRARLHPASATHFTLRAAKVDITFAGSGTATTMTVVQAGSPPDVGKRYEPKM